MKDLIALHWLQCLVRCPTLPIRRTGEIFLFTCVLTVLTDDGNNIGNDTISSGIRSLHGLDRFDQASFTPDSIFDRSG